MNGTILPTTKVLHEIKLFQVFSEQDLLPLIENGEAKTYEAYVNIIIEGEQSWGLYLILDGTVGIFKSNALSGNTYDVGQLGKGSFFGEMSLVDENPRSATVRALTDCQLFYISKEVFSVFLDHSDGQKLRFYETCVKTLVSRLRELDDNYVTSQYLLWKTALLKEKEAA